MFSVLLLVSCIFWIKISMMWAKLALTAWTEHMLLPCISVLALRAPASLWASLTCWQVEKKQSQSYKPSWVACIFWILVSSSSIWFSFSVTPKRYGNIYVQIWNVWSVYIQFLFQVRWITVPIPSKEGRIIEREQNAFVVPFLAALHVQNIYSVTFRVLFEVQIEAMHFRRHTFSVTRQIKVSVFCDYRNSPNARTMFSPGVCSSINILTI